MNTFGYMRISTKANRELQSYTRQIKSLERYEAESGKLFTLVFQEDKSGKNFTDRTEWQKLENIVQEGDTIVFKDISRFTREADNGYKKYMELMEKGVDLIFIDNPTVSTPYIKQLMNVAKEQSLVARTSLEGTIKLLLIVELDRVQQEREITCNRIRQGIAASEKKSGRKVGQLDKMNEDLKDDIKMFLNDRSIKQIDLMEKHNISRNTLKKYITIMNEAIHRGEA